MLDPANIIINENKQIKFTPNYFFHTHNGKPEQKYQTDITISQLGDGLKFNFYCYNDNHIEDNTYTENNSAMWNQEVFEIFIAPGSDSPSEYFEIEVNPNGAIYTDLIKNTDLTGKNNSHLFLDAKANGIKHEITKDIYGHSYFGEIFLPFKLIGKSKEYRINFYRVVSNQNHTNKNWACTPSTCLFLAFNPTMSGSSPQFHLPKKMSLLSLQDN
jgi:hypothetical protein